MTGDQRSDSELLASLPRQPELMGVLYERHAPAVFRYLARRAGRRRRRTCCPRSSSPPLARASASWPITAAARCPGCTGSP